jgi:hypothetical protein
MVDMPVVAMPTAVMARASGMTTPVMAARPSVMRPVGAGRGGRPDSRYRCENARNN